MVCYSNVVIMSLHVISSYTAIVACFPSIASRYGKSNLTAHGAVQAVTTPCFSISRTEEFCKLFFSRPCNEGLQKFLCFFKTPGFQLEPDPEVTKCISIHLY